MTENKEQLETLFPKLFWGFALGGKMDKGLFHGLGFPYTNKN